MTNSVQRRHYERQRTVFLDENCIRFAGKVNAYAHRQFMWCLHECRKRNDQAVTLDFSTCEKAFPNGMIPLLSNADSLRRENVDVSVTLPDKDHLRRLFLNANWAHLLEPARYPKSDTADYQHMAAQRFTGPEDQQRLVNTFMDVVMRNMTLERRVIAGLEWSINEITDNVLNHAECNEGGIVQVSTFKEARKVTFGVADSGRGILSSLREGHPDIQTDVQAIQEAVKAGTTRNPDAGQGNGIAGALRIATVSKGSFEITSGLANLVVREGTDRHYERREPQRFPGTFVYAELGIDARFHLSKALGFYGEPHQPTDIIELRYGTETGEAVVLDLHKEATGFGSRAAGRQLRTKCMNLLNAEPTKPLLLDWSGIPLVSSSFADELVGKLFSSLGPLAFSARVRNVHMETIVRGIVDKAIMQRVAQVANGTGENDDTRWSRFPYVIE